MHVHIYIFVKLFLKSFLDSCLRSYRIQINPKFIEEDSEIPLTGVVLGHGLLRDRPFHKDNHNARVESTMTLFPLSVYD